MSCNVRTAVVPSLNVKSENSSSPFLAAAPLRFTTPFSSTLAFFPSETPNLEMSGSESPLAPLARDFYIDYYILKQNTYLEALVTIVLDDGLHFIISEQVNGISGGV